MTALVEYTVQVVRWWAGDPEVLVGWVDTTIENIKILDVK